MCAVVRALVARVWKHSLGRPVRALVALCFASDMAINFAAKPVETLKNTNVQTAKHASWVVRVLSPKIIPYTFSSKGQPVAAVRWLK